MFLKSMLKYPLVLLETQRENDLRNHMEVFDMFVPPHPFMYSLTVAVVLNCLRLLTPESPIFRNVV